MATEHFPDAIQIVDRFHATQHLSDVGKAIYGATRDLGRAWSKARHDELDEGKIDDIRAALAAHAAANAEARKCIGYVNDNRERMRYAEFRAARLCTSTGVVEAGCKVAIGTWLKRTGMHWTVAGRRDHRPASLLAERRVRGLLGAAVNGHRVRSSHNPDVRPVWP